MGLDPLLSKKASLVKQADKFYQQLKALGFNDQIIKEEIKKMIKIIY
jgi:hypothetical protein